MSDIARSGEPRGGAVLLAPEVVLSAAAIALFALWPPAGAFDFWLQAHLFDLSAGGWLVPPDSRGLLYWLFYRGPKMLLAIVAAAILLRLLAVALRRRWRDADTRLLLALCVVGLTPLIVGMLKTATGVSCPSQEIAFGGPYFHVAIWDRLSGLVPFDQGLRCWPAGHASAGFGLLGYRLLAPARLSPGLRYWLPGLAAGWTLGIFQMMRGQHYLSHTVVTMALAILISSLALAIRDRLTYRC